MKSHRFTVKLIALLVAAATMVGCMAACSGDKTSDVTDSATQESLLPGTDAPDTATDPATEPATETPTEAPVLWEDYVEPAGAQTTDLSVSGTIKGDGKAPVQAVTYTYAPNDPAFTLKEADAEGTTVTLRPNTVSVLQMNSLFQDDATASYQATVQVTGKNESADWNVLYIGLRLSNVGGDATGKNGVWFAIREHEIGLRTGDWPNTTYMTLREEGVDFTEARMLYILDDMTTDVITVMADNDSGEKVTLAVIKIDGDTVSMYHPGEETPTITDSGVEVPGSGYFNIWLHHMANGPVYITDLTATGTQGAKKTAEDANMMNSKDVLADTWVSTDDVGRVTGTANGAVGDKKVGIFYFLWHDPNIHGGDGKIYNHTETYYTGGQDALIDVMQQGPLGFAHYWAEPYFGYYRSDDEWVIRKHTYQLVAAGIDFIYIDATNGLTYENTYETILRVWSEMRAEGYETPQIMFHCGDNMSIAPKSFEALWNNLYSTGRYEELWFKHEGKPLIFIPRDYYESLPEEQKDFFAVRHSWANSKDAWYRSNHGKNCWPWADMYPQGPGLSSKRKIEQMIVMSGFWVNGSFGTNGGRSYSYKNGGQPAGGNFGFDLVDSGSSGLGIGFEEQFEYAIEQDPGIIMLVGWNEWWAGRWEAEAAVGQTVANTYVVTDDDQWTRHYYVDAFNPEFSRDIEPVKGVYNDNYYYQMAQNIRQYKGSRVNLAAFGQRPIDLDAPQSQWDIVGPEYRDYAGDVTERDAMSYVGQIHYTNDSGRNDFVVAKVSKNGKDVVFYAECAEDITAPEGTNWMNLFIDADCSAETGWYGYDYVVNRTQSGNTCSIMRFLNNSWEMEEVGSASYTVCGNYIQIKVDADLLGLGDTFDFKWADNSVDDGDIMQFIDRGDAAPNDRFNYRYTTVETEVVIPEVLTEGMTVLKAGSYYAYAGGRMVRLDESSTKAVFFGDEDHLYVPKAFATEVMGLTVSGESCNHYGIEYVDITAALESCGKTVTRSADMLVLADAPVDEAVLLTLYRALY